MCKQKKLVQSKHFKMISCAEWMDLCLSKMQGLFWNILTEEDRVFLSHIPLLRMQYTISYSSGLIRRIYAYELTTYFPSTIFILL